MKEQSKTFATWIVALTAGAVLITGLYHFKHDSGTNRAECIFAEQGSEACMEPVRLTDSQMVVMESIRTKQKEQERKTALSLGTRSPNR